MDPLVKLDENLAPTPSLAQSWDVSANGKTVTFHLRPDGRSTNGDPVTAQDFEYSWKRTLSPELGADYAYQLYGIVGAEDYNSCESTCAPVRDRVGVRAVDKSTLRVSLTSPQPWFLQQAAHHSFLAVHPATVERFGRKWTEAANIVTNGPFKLAEWVHDANIDLVKWADWRAADTVSLNRVNGLMLTEGTTALQAFDDIPNLDQRRAMALAIDRRAIIDNITHADQVPATGYTPAGDARLRHDQPEVGVAA
jgi:ABC-type oligopeptide transport system substrate-binding subunit